jgi:DNA-binding SARP family transcriptional activator/DNA-binding CsgD family transcriptional regulator
LRDAVKFAILGPIELRAGELRRTPGGPQQVALLAFLLVHANRAVSNDRLHDALWSAQQPEGASKRVQVAIARLRRSLVALESDGAGPALHTVSGGYVLAVAAGELDAQVFEDRVTEGRALLDGADPDPAAASSTLRDALALWRGPPLAEVAFADFAQPEIRRLDELRLTALESRFDAELTLGHHRDAISELQAIAAKHPQRERLCEQLMLALYRCGRQGDALDVYARLSARLSSELGLRPGPALRTLQQAVLEHAVWLDPDAVLPAVRHTAAARAARAVDAPAPPFAKPPAVATLAEVDGGGMQLVERAEEMRRVRQALDAAVSGAGSLLIVEGPAGIGKSRLLAEAGVLARTAGLQVLRARGGVMERDLAYGAVRLLLERPLAAMGEDERADVLTGAAALAAPALATAGAEQQAPADRGFAVDHGLFWCIANLAERRALLLALDDAHWFDAPSLRFLHYLARRVADLPVMMLVASRPDEDGREALLAQRLTVQPGAQLLRPAPLTPDGVGAVLRERMAHTVAPEFAASCHTAVRGNPFLLSELAGALVADGIAPTADAAARVRHVRPPTLSRAILLRLGRMPTGATQLATAVAVLGEEVSLALARQDEAIAAEALDRLAAAEILLPRLPLNFVHPIVREAVYGELGPAQRAGWHARASALVLDAGGPIERAAPHLLSTTPEGNASTVQTLRRAARGALDRGASDIAARYLNRALAEPPPEEERAATLLELGGAGFLAAEPVHQVKAHIREALGLMADARTRAEAWLLLSRATAMDRSVPGAVAVLEEALEDLEGLVAEQLAPLENELCSHGVTHPATIARVAARLDRIKPPPGRTAAERLVLCNLASRRSFAGRSAALTDELTQRALAGGQLATELGADNTTLHHLAYALAGCDRVDAALALLDVALAESRARGSVFGIAAAAGTRSFMHYLIGSLADAESDGQHALAVPGVPPFVIPAISSFVCLALVERGALDEADIVIARSGVGPELPEVLHMHFAFWARSRLRTAQGRLADARDDLAEFRRRSERVDLYSPTISWRADAALVHARLGEHATAAALADEYDELARAWGTPATLGISARTRGLLAAGERALALLRTAVEAHEASPARLEHSRSLLELGRALRRSGQRAKAIELLRDAAGLAQRCGATALAARASDELHVAGAVKRRHAFSGAMLLTPSELRIARMAKDGATNREIAETLFVTTKSVENHLGRTYTKLGIATPTELSGALGDMAAPLQRSDRERS